MAVVFYLAEHGLPDTPEIRAAVLMEAKRGDRVLCEDEIVGVIKRFQANKE